MNRHFAKVLIALHYSESGIKYYEHSKHLSVIPIKILVSKCFMNFIFLITLLYSNPLDNQYPTVVVNKLMKVQYLHN